MPSLTKRSFLKLAAASAASIPALQAHASEGGEKFDVTTDVLVIGYGGAGASAAITAHDAGAKVLLLEKMPRAGGNTEASGGGFIIPKDAGQAYEYLEKTFLFADNEMDGELVKTFCEGAVKLPEFFKRIAPGARLRVTGHANYPYLPHADNITKYRVGGKKSGGIELIAALKKCVEERKIETWLNSPALELIREGNTVVGATARHDGRVVRIRARRGVILTTGGYEYDKQSLQNFCQGTKVLGLGNPGNTGDGLRMAASMGARMWHMTSYSCPLGIRIPGCKAAVFVTMMTPNYIIVNQDGKRFCNEAGVDFHGFIYAVNQLDGVKHRYPAIPCYIVMDEAGRLAGRPTHFKYGYAAGIEGYHWSADSSAEIKSGIVKKADTLDELAKMIRVPAENLKAQVARWNKDIKAGADTEFGRKIKKTGKSAFASTDVPTLSAPLAEKGPYYAIECYPALLNTQGGPKRDAKARVMDVYNRPIPHLFVAGELGSIWGSIYQGSSNVCEALVYGQIAGASAAAEKPL